MVNITFLGTGQAIPTASRNHTSILLSYKNENILVDCGEGTQRQFRKAKLTPCKLTKILITHWHGDHVLGLPGLIQTLALSDYNKELEIYGPVGTKRYVKELFSVFAFAGERIKIGIKELSEGKFFENEDFELESFRLKHGMPTLGYNFIIKEKLRIDKEKLEKLKIKAGEWLNEIKEKKDVVVEGKKVEWKEITYKEKGKKVSFVFDTGYFSGIGNKVDEADLLICESTYSEKDKEKAKEYKHMTSKEAASLAKKAKAKKLFLVHLSQRYEKDSENILAEAKKVFKNTELAADLMKIEV